MLQEMIPPQKLMLAFIEELFERDYSIWDGD